jgi:hypothetical protein
MKIAGKKFCGYGIGSYFKIPEQDMLKYEVLSRGSLILVPSKKKHFRIVSAAHIPFPFYYPKLYDMVDKYEWLNFVEEEHVYNTLQIRDEFTGAILEEFRISDRIIKHPSLDLAIMDLTRQEEIRFIEKFTGEKYNRKTLSEESRSKLNIVDLTENFAGDGQQVELHGFSLTMLDESKEEVMVPEIMRGDVVGKSETRTFLQTFVPSKFGYCGCPAIIPDKNICIGMVEGLISSIKGDDYLEMNNSTVLISALEIMNFIDSVENNE